MPIRPGVKARTTGTQALQGPLGTPCRRARGHPKSSGDPRPELLEGSGGIPLRATSPKKGIRHAISLTLHRRPTSPRRRGSRSFPVSVGKLTSKQFKSHRNSLPLWSYDGSLKLADIDKVASQKNSTRNRLGFHRATWLAQRWPPCLGLAPASQEVGSSMSLPLFCVVRPVHNGTNSSTQARGRGDVLLRHRTAWPPPTVVAIDHTLNTLGNDRNSVRVYAWHCAIPRSSGTSSLWESV